jgi:hypothetical protein
MANARQCDAIPRSSVITLAGRRLSPTGVVGGERGNVSERTNNRDGRGGLLLTDGAIRSNEMGSGMSEQNVEANVLQRMERCGSVRP